MTHENAQTTAGRIRLFSRRGSPVATARTQLARIVGTDTPLREDRKNRYVTHEDAPVLPGISPQSPGRMPRAEDDEATRAHSPDFNDRPGSGKHTADRLNVF
jgi:hypothetical protein